MRRGGIEILPKADEHPPQVRVEARVGQYAVEARRIGARVRVAEGQTPGDILVETDRQAMADRLLIQLHQAQHLSQRALRIARTR